VVPVKRLTTAKTRLTSATGQARERLALAFCLDTVEAAMACPRVIDVVVVTDDDTAAAALAGLGATVVGDEPDDGLNPALVHGAAAALRLHPTAAIAALSADLPSLRPRELTVALDAGLRNPVSVVRDVAGDGTTLLLAAPGSRLEPQFGHGSGDRHVSVGAIDISTYDIASLRRDVDTDEDLREAIALGIGRRSAEVVRDLGLDVPVGSGGL
jgi:2-phospho-L-lactate guanylyltransferase